jgi:hypothetical protein
MALTTPAQISDRIYEEREYFISDRDRATHELADSLTPVYYSEIIEEWRELPSEFSDAWQEFGSVENATISSLMTTDLWLYYHAQIERALDEIHLCETELPAPLYYATAHFTGAGVVKCHGCSYTCASWDCPCDFSDHECVIENN